MEHVIALEEQLHAARDAYSAISMTNRAGKTAVERVELDIAEGKAMDRLVKLRAAYDEALKPLIQAAE